MIETVPGSATRSREISAGRRRTEIRRRQRADLGWAGVFLAPQLIGLAVFVLGPLVYALLLSSMEWDGLTPMRFVGIDNFVRQFQSGVFLESLVNTMYFTVLLVPGELVLSLLVAVAVHAVRGRVIYRVLYFMPVVTSSVAVSVVWLWILNGDFGPLNAGLRSIGLDPPNWLADTRTVIPALAVVSIWRGLGFTMVVLLAGLQAIPREYQEAASIDGAGPVRRFTGITLPLLSPTLLFLTIISFIGSFQVFDLAFTMTRGGPQHASFTLVYDVYDLAFNQFRFGDGSAVAVILFLILLVVTAVQLRLQRRFVHYEE